MLTSPNDLSITPPGTAHDAQIMAAFKTVGLQAFECRTEAGSHAATPTPATSASDFATWPA